MTIRRFAPILLLALGTGVHAAPQSCTGKILRYLTYAEGNVMILPDWRGDWLYVCNLNTPWKGVSAASCAAWFATVKTAVSLPSKPAASIAYVDAPACATIPTFGNAPAPDSITLP